jgi:hypothetical protein
MVCRTFAGLFLPRVSSAVRRSRMIGLPRAAVAFAGRLASLAARTSLRRGSSAPQPHAGVRDALQSSAHDWPGHGGMWPGSFCLQWTIVHVSCCC